MSAIQVGFMRGPRARSAWSGALPAVAFAGCLVVAGTPETAWAAIDVRGGTSSSSVAATFDLSQIHAAPANVEILNAGTIPSQGDFNTGVYSPALSTAPGGMNSLLARTTYGVSGAGIKIGIISDSYNQLGGAAAGVASGNLPGPGNPLNAVPVTVLQDDLVAGRTDEGRGMAEIVHDIAPGAQLYFHSAFNIGTGQAPIANAITALRNAGCNIIVDDVGFLTEPYFQPGLPAQAATAAKNAGRAYFSSAGNSARNSWEGTFNGGSAAGSVMNFDANANEAGIQKNILRVSIPGGGATTRITLQWNDPYRSVGAPAGAVVNDYKLELVDITTGAVVSGIVSDQNQATGGADAYEIIGVTNSGATGTLGVRVTFNGGTASNRLLKMIVNGSSFAADDDNTSSGTVVGHAAADGVIAVAANRYDNGTGVESFSSRGNASIFLNPNGSLINADGTAVIKNTPQLTAPQGANTTFFGGSDYEGDGSPNFFGTSAAAPHAAAVAALMMERAQQLGTTLTIDELYSLMQSTATDLTPAGYDDSAGFGRLNAFAAITAVVPEPTGAAALALFIGATAGLRRRRRTA